MMGWSRYVLAGLVCTAWFAPCHARPFRTPLEQAVDRALAGQDAAAVVLRVRDGQVLAAHNLTTLTQRVASPGSAIKPFVLQLLLEERLVAPRESIACRRGLTIAGKRLNCSHPVELQTFTAEDALAFSCNSYFVTAAARLKPGELERRFRELGFAQPSGLLPGEGQGRIADARTLAERQLLAIGVAGIQVTPLELASAYVKLARLDRSAASASDQVVLAGLHDSAGYGMARNASPQGLSVLGKTGTASDPPNSYTHAWFAGFAPAERPEIVVVVFVERGRGSVEAAELARAIFAAYEEERR